MKEKSYADLHAGDYEVSHTFGPAGEVYYFLNEPQYVKQLQDWMHGHYCPHPQLHDALSGIAQAFGCKPTPSKASSAILSSYYDGEPAPDHYWPGIR